jgi:Tol biopolymer transport system component
MNNRLIVWLSLISACLPTVAAAGAAAGYINQPLYFIPNQGQVNARSLFYARARSYTLWLTQDGLVFDSWKPTSGAHPTVFERDVSRLVFKDASPSAELAAEDLSGATVSYFYGRDPDDWKTGLPAARGVVYRGVYPGIDLKIYGSGREVEYDWIVGPGGDPARIRLELQGIRGARIGSEGSLIVETSLGDIRHRRPAAYQISGGRKVAVAARFLKTADREYGFWVGAYDRTRPLVIDPYILAYSTYLGGSQYDRITAIATDASKAIYVCGQTESADFPLAVGLSRAAAARRDDFVAKLSPDGSSLVYSAFFPAKYIGFVRLAVDASGSVYLVGTTDTRFFPVKNAFQAKPGGYDDGFIVKLKPNGRAIDYASYIGGSNNDYAHCVAVDAKGYAYVGGQTGSYNLPIKKAFQKTYEGYDDGYLLKVAPDGRSLVFATYFGGSLSDVITGIGLSPDGAITIGGDTYSRDLPTKNPFQKHINGSADLFLAQFSPDGQNLAFSTYLGGRRWDQLMGLAVDPTGQIVATGFTDGFFPVKNPVQAERKGGREGVVAQLSADGRKLLFATYLGGVGDDECHDVAVDGAGTIYVTGMTYSRDFPVKAPTQKKLKGKIDSFLTILAPSVPKLVFSTFLGGIYHEWDAAVALDSDGGVYVGGTTNSQDFPVKGAYQTKYGGGQYDGFVSVFKTK